MILLDTNVISEATKPEPHPGLPAWLNQQAAETLYLSSVTLAELLFGVSALPVGKRKNMLANALAGLMRLFKGCSGTECFHSAPMRSVTAPCSPSQPNLPGADLQRRHAREDTVLCRNESDTPH
jgi:PIN domain